tara:strand:+ start:7508 stop:8413 length:906 start_codon:yes stop_codon:yes gene_type:complete
MNFISNILDNQFNVLKKNNKLKKNLLISSVGNKSVHRDCNWNYTQKNYNTLFIYYEKFIPQESDYYLKMKGKKLSQYYYIFQTKLINYYDYIFILDNDNIISGKKISELFDLSHKLKANILAPSVKIKDIHYKKVHKFLNFFYNDFVKIQSKKKYSNYWTMRDDLPKDLINTYDQCRKYSAWVHMIQRFNLKDKIIKKVNIVEDGRSIIKTDLILKFRKNKKFMKLFDSGVIFDHVLANLCKFKRIYVIDYISYIHRDPYKDKEREHIEGKKIIKYIKKNNTIKNFKMIWPDMVKENFFTL